MPFLLTWDRFDVFTFFRSFDRSIFILEFPDLFLFQLSFFHFCSCCASDFPLFLYYLLGFVQFNKVV